MSSFQDAPDKAIEADEAKEACSSLPICTQFVPGTVRKFSPSLQLSIQ